MFVRIMSVSCQQMFLQALVSKLKGSSSSSSSTTPATAAAGTTIMGTSPSMVSSSGIVSHQAAGGSSNAISKDSKGAASAEAGVIKSVLATLGALAQQAGIEFQPYVLEVMPLVIEAIQVRGFGWTVVSWQLLESFAVDTSRKKNQCAAIAA